MTNEFFDTGLESDRYLKAAKLTDRFETELRRELRQAGDAIVADNDELFVDVDYTNWNQYISSSGGVLAFARFDYRMTRRNPDTNDRLKLNIAFRWVEPGKMGHDATGALTIHSYKIKNAPETDYLHVKENTRRGTWDAAVGNDPHENYPAVFYVPVRNLDEFRRGQQALKEHFSEFGSMFGIESKS